MNIFAVQSLVSEFLSIFTTRQNVSTEHFIICLKFCARHLSVKKISRRYCYSSSYSPFLAYNHCDSAPNYVQLHVNISLKRISFPFVKRIVYIFIFYFHFIAPKSLIIERRQSFFVNCTYSCTLNIFIVFFLPVYRVLV